MKKTKIKAAGLYLAADVGGPEDGPPVILSHGGGQTRFAWGKAAGVLAAGGYRVVSVDLRGHGESDWASDRDYTLATMAEDLKAVAGAFDRAPALVGASLGGLASLYALSTGLEASALVLVDIVPKFNAEGAAKIGAFMAANPDGFASLEEAADAVSAYMPHRPRPKDVSGLKKNLREKEGRLYWHWDPAFITGPRSAEGHELAVSLDAVMAAVTAPTLLVRGMTSEIVDEEGIRHMREMIPHAQFVDVQGAGHMVAGDKNDAFNEAVISFLQGLG